MSDLSNVNMCLNNAFMYFQVGDYLIEILSMYLNTCILYVIWGSVVCMMPTERITNPIVAVHLLYCIPFQKCVFNLVLIKFKNESP